LLPADFDYGTGEEAALRVIGALDNLAKQLRQLEDIPLEVSAVQGTSAVFRYCDVFPAVSSLRRIHKQAETEGKSCLLQMESAGVPALHWVSPAEGMLYIEFQLFFCISCIWKLSYI
jgi:U3 small nucleolar RNA-associated protein 22